MVQTALRDEPTNQKNTRSNPINFTSKQTQN